MITKLLKRFLKGFKSRPKMMWELAFVSIIALVFVVVEVAVVYLAFGATLWILDLLLLPLVAWFIQAVIVGLWFGSQLDEIYGKLETLS